MTQKTTSCTMQMTWFCSPPPYRCCIRAEIVLAAESPGVGAGPAPKFPITLTPKPCSTTHLSTTHVQPYTHPLEFWFNSTQIGEARLGLTPPPGPLALQQEVFEETGSTVIHDGHTASIEQTVLYQQYSVSHMEPWDTHTNIFSDRVNQEV